MDDRQVFYRCRLFELCLRLDDVRNVPCIFHGEAFAQQREVFMESTFLELQDKRCAEAIRQKLKKSVQTLRQSGCRNCSAMALGGLQEFATLLLGKLKS